MSKIGKKPIQLPEGVEIKMHNQTLLVKGPKGELTLSIPTVVDVSVQNQVLTLQPLNNHKSTRALWGLSRSLLANAVQGITQGYEKNLELVGVGYRVQPQGAGIELEVGFSHKVQFAVPGGIELTTEKNTIRVRGTDKQLVGQTAANIRAIRPPEPYKGKGIRYVGERIKLKPGKSAKAGTTT